MLEQEQEHLVVTVMRGVVEHGPVVPGLWNFFCDWKLFFRIFKGLPQFFKFTLSAACIELHFLFYCVLHGQEVVPAPFCNRFVVLGGAQIHVRGITRGDEVNFWQVCWLNFGCRTVGCLIIFVWWVSWGKFGNVLRTVELKFIRLLLVQRVFAVSCFVEWIDHLRVGLLLKRSLLYGNLLWKHLWNQYEIKL